jgi:hypothetical protein
MYLPQEALLKFVVSSKNTKSIFFTDSPFIILIVIIRVCFFLKKTVFREVELEAYSVFRKRCTKGIRSSLVLQ